MKPEEMNERFADLNAQVDEMNHRLEDAREERNELLRQRFDLKEQRRYFRAQLRDAKAEDNAQRISEVESRLSELGAQLDDLDEKIDALEEAIDETSDQIDDIMDGVDDLEDVLDDAAALQDYLKTLPKPAAVFAANDCAADVVLKSCMRNGLRSPEDLAVLGVDDDPVFCVHTRPTLSSIHPDFEEMGYVAAKELARLMSGKFAGRRIVVAGGQTVTKRMSTAPCSPAGVLVRRVDEIIAARACERIDSDVIASELKISRRLLDLRYRQLTGKSVREAIIQARVDRAKHLLTYSGHPIGTISRLCGYRTESYLGKVFMSHEGVSMGEYRSRHGKGEERSSS